MTILFLTRLFYPHVGGVEEHVLQVGKRLAKKEDRLIVVTEELPKIDLQAYQSKSQSAKDRQILGNIDVIRLNVAKNGRRNWFTKFVIWRELFRHRELIKKADIVHCHDVFFWYLPFKFIYFRKPVFTTFHGYEGIFPPSRKAVLIRKVSEKLSWGNICVGDFIKKWYGTKPDYVTYGGVEITRVQNSKLQVKTQNYKSKLKILFIGRLEEDTGIPAYLEVLRLLKKRGVDFEFGAAGDGSLRSRVAQYGKVYGFIDNIQEYVKNADIVFASSYLSILEVLACKKPVFSIFNNPLKKDYLEMAPFAKWTAIDNSAEKLADKISYYKNHKQEQQEFIDSAYNWVRNQTWDKVADMYLKLYEKVF